jgi:broad specificity phosphatase PhoE
MPADRIHLVRHGEVHNPEGVLYGRLPNFGLSELGHKMALAAAEEIKSQGRRVAALFCSPLQRTRESARPFTKIFGLDPIADDRLIEPTNVFQGQVLSASRLMFQPHRWIHFRNPNRPSWGEPYIEVVARMTEAVLEAANSVESGDVVIVSHQLPIWMMHSSVAGIKLPHNPTQRRCTLSSITSFEMVDGKLVEVDYREPAKRLSHDGNNPVPTDVGAV